MELSTLMATSSLDGRYRKTAEKLAPSMSEFALIQNRVRVIIDFILALSEHGGILPRQITDAERAILKDLKKVTLEQALIIQQIEREGYQGIKATNHDVVAVIEFLRHFLKGSSLQDLVEWIHFGNTSEDVNNVAYGLMLREAIGGHIYPAISKLVEMLKDAARRYADLPMLSRTHGQPATPTTLGKEFKVFEQRLLRQLEKLSKFQLLVKHNGASGNHCAHVAAFPAVDWLELSQKFVTGYNNREDGSSLLPFEWNPYTTQIESHDTYAELFGILQRINTILINFCRDVWDYIKDDLIVQKPKEGEVGSSAMPHKVNPIDFENAEGNLGLANTLLQHFIEKLPISRRQRDLSDSTVERAFGLALGHCLIAYGSIARGLGKISADERAIRAELDDHPEILAEAYQTILRREGTLGAYNLLKEASRGKKVTLTDYRRLILTLEVGEKVKQELLALTPASYIGLAPQLAQGA